MQGLRRLSNDVVQLDLNPPGTAHSSSLSMDVGGGSSEPAEAKIQRLISEHPVIIFSRSACCMCHVMKKLLATIGVHPTVIELDDHEISALPGPASPTSSSSSSCSGSDHPAVAPSVFIGGTCVGGLESLVALHLGGHLVPKLVEVGALVKNIIGYHIIKGVNLGFEKLPRKMVGAHLPPVPLGWEKTADGDHCTSNINEPGTRNHHHIFKD